jgi:hypothetical protein
LDQLALFQSTCRFWMRSISPGDSGFLGLAVALKPPAEGRMRFTGASAGEKAFDTDVFVQIGPVYALAFADQPPVRTFGRATMGEPRIPRQWNRDRPTIDKGNDQRIVRERDLLRPRLGDLSR